MSIIDKYLSFRPSQPVSCVGQACREAKDIGILVSDLVCQYGGGSARKYVSACSVFPVLKEAMAARGWTFSGSGYFAAVFTKGEAALKIGLKKEDSGAVYAAWARANAGTPGIPTIHHLSRYDGCYVVVMDRLRPFNPDDCQWRTAEFREAQEALVGRPVDYQFPAAVAAAKIRAFFEGMAEFDLHHQNVMLDNSGNLIITDPVSFVGAANDNSDYYYYTYYTEAVYA